jgi:hypothetical protein
MPTGNTLLACPQEDGLLSPAEYAAFHQTNRGRADRCVSCNSPQHAHGRFAEVMELSVAQCCNCTSTASKADQQDVCRDSCRCRAVCVSREGRNMQHVSQVSFWCCYCSICIRSTFAMPSRCRGCDDALLAEHETQEGLDTLSCCRVYMPQNYKKCDVSVADPFCAGNPGPESKPYITNVNQTWAWSAKIQQACSMPHPE